MVKKFSLGMPDFVTIRTEEKELVTTFENGQARERTQILMDIANQANGMVIGTGDMSELALGWATYNGDHMSMYGVNGSVPKTLVRHLVRYYADTCEDQELRDVLLDILDTPVSPELLPPKDGEIAQITDLVAAHDLKPECIMLTHAHFDHIYGLADCARTWNIPAYMDVKEKSAFEHTNPYVCRNYGLELPEIPEEDVFRYVSDGDEISVGDLKFEVLGTPGHSFCIIFSSLKPLISGMFTSSRIRS